MCPTDKIQFSLTHAFNEIPNISFAVQDSLVLLLDKKLDKHLRKKNTWNLWSLTKHCAVFGNKLSGIYRDLNHLMKLVYKAVY